MTLFNPPIAEFDYTKKCKKCHYLSIQKINNSYWCVNCEKYVQTEQTQQEKKIDIAVKEIIQKECSYTQIIAKNTTDLSKN